MRRSGKVALSISGIALWLLFAAPASAQLSKEPVKASDLVVLRASGAACTIGTGGLLLDQRLLPNGTTVPFSIPPKSVLIVNDAYGETTGGTPGADNRLVLNYEVGPQALGQVFGIFVNDATGDGRTPNVRPNFSHVLASGQFCCDAPNGTVDFCQASGFFAKAK